MSLSTPPLVFWVFFVCLCSFFFYYEAYQKTKITHNLWRQSIGTRLSYVTDAGIIRLGLLIFKFLLKLKARKEQGAGGEREVSHVLVYFWDAYLSRSWAWMKLWVSNYIQVPLKDIKPKDITHQLLPPTLVISRKEDMGYGNSKGSFSTRTNTIPHWVFKTPKNVIGFTTESRQHKRPDT